MLLRSRSSSPWSLMTMGSVLFSPCRRQKSRSIALVSGGFSCPRKLGKRGFEEAILFQADFAALAELECWKGNEKFIVLRGAVATVGASGVCVVAGSRNFTSCSAIASLTVSWGGSFLCSLGTSCCCSATPESCGEACVVVD